MSWRYFFTEKQESVPSDFPGSIANCTGLFFNGRFFRLMNIFSVFAPVLVAPLFPTGGTFNIWSALQPFRHFRVHRQEVFHRQSILF
jgi:hypothetical protein